MDFFIYFCNLQCLCNHFRRRLAARACPSPATSASQHLSLRLPRGTACPPSSAGVLAALVRGFGAGKSICCLLSPLPLLKFRVRKASRVKRVLQNTEGSVSKSFATSPLSCEMAACAATPFPPYCGHEATAAGAAHVGTVSLPGALLAATPCTAPGERLVPGQASCSQGNQLFCEPQTAFIYCSGLCTSGFEPTLEEAKRRQTREANTWSKRILVFCAGASELHNIHKFGLSFTKSICLIRFM